MYGVPRQQPDALACSKLGVCREYDGASGASVCRIGYVQYSIHEEMSEHSFVLGQSFELNNVRGRTREAGSQVPSIFTGTSSPRLRFAYRIHMFLNDVTGNEQPPFMFTTHDT